MTVRNLFLLPGDGIGPEAMGGSPQDHRLHERGEDCRFRRPTKVSSAASAYDAHGAAISEADMAKATGGRRRSLRRRRRPEVGQRTL